LANDDLRNRDGEHSLEELQKAFEEEHRDEFYNAHGEIVGNFYRTLTRKGIPLGLAGTLTKQFAKQLVDGYVDNTVMADKEGRAWQREMARANLGLDIANSEFNPSAMAMLPEIAVDVSGLEEDE